MHRAARRRPSRRRHPGAPAVLALAAAVALACAPRQEDTTTAIEPTEPERVENPTLGIALAGPQAAGFDVVANEAETLRLVRHATEEEAEATLVYEVGPPQTAGVNLVAAVRDQEAMIEARPEGEFLGQVELMSQLGPAFSTRGRYTGEAGEQVEEIKVFALHPSGDRLLSLTYSYVPTEGGTKVRTDQAMAALGLVEPLATTPEEGA